MGIAYTVWTTLVRIGLVMAFVGLGVLGIVLLGMAVTLPGSILHRLAVVVLGVGGIVIALGYVQTIRAPT